MQEERKPIGYKPRALDGGYGWVVVFGSFLIHVFADGFVYSFGVIAESLIKEFNSTNTEVSTILSLLTGLMLAAGPIASAVCNRIGCRITTIIGALIASFGCALSYFANSMMYLIISVGIVMGIGFGLMYCPAIVIVTIYFEKYRSLATGVTVCGAGVGTFVFSQVIGILIVQFNWRTVFLIYAAIVLLCVPCGALYRPVEFVPVYEDGDESSSSEGEEESGVNDNCGNGDAENEKMMMGKEMVVANGGEAVTNTKPTQINFLNGNTHTIGSSDNVQQQKQFQTAVAVGPLRSAHSHQQINKVEGGTANGGGGGPNGVDLGLLQRFFSIGDHLNVSSQQQANKKHHHHHHGGGAISVSTGYLNVKDVFYPGSITELPEYKENRSRFRSVGSLHSTTARGIASSVLQIHSADIRRIEEEKDDEVELELRHPTPPGAAVDSQQLVKEENEAEEAANRAIEVWRTIKRMLDLSLLTNPIYLLFGISNFLTSIGFNAPPMFMPMNAEIVLGWDKMQASKTVSAYGLANTFGRIAFGLICDRRLPTRWGNDRARNRLWIYNLTLVLCGLLSCFVFAMTTYYGFLAYSFAFGFTISSYVCLTSVVLVDLVGVDRLTNAFGLLLFIQGIATFVGPPLAGKLYDLTRRYDWTFAFCGVCLFISGAMLFVIPWMQTKHSGQKGKSKEMGSTKTATVTTTLKLNAEEKGALIDNNGNGGNGGGRRRSYEAV